MVTETKVLLTDVVGEAAHPLTGDVEDYNPLLDLIGDASLVLIGEASHGTHEFYRERAQITKRLIKEKGFTAVLSKLIGPTLIVLTDMFRAAALTRMPLTHSRDSNVFPHGCGETPTSWILLDGYEPTMTIFLPRRRRSGFMV